MEITLIILTSMLFISTVVIIGKFFCVSFLETVYDEISDDYELEAGFFITYWVSLLLLITVWVLHIFQWGMVGDDPLLAIICATFGLLTGAAHNLIVIVQTIKCVLVPHFQRMHQNIKRRKRG